MVSYTHSYISDEDRFMVSIEGHAGYAPEGSDIVCAAASVLAFTLIEAIVSLDQKGFLERLYRSVEKGSIQLDFTVKPSGRDKAEAILSAVAGGYALLGDNFPEYVEAEY